MCIDCRPRPLYRCENYRNSGCPSCMAGGPRYYDGFGCRGSEMEYYDGFGCRGSEMEYLMRMIDDMRRNMEYMSRGIFPSVQVEKLTTNNKKMPKKVGNMMKRLLDADTQKMVKAGFINGDLELTEMGQKVLWAIIFSANKTEFVKEADAAIAEAAEATK